MRMPAEQVIRKAAALLLVVTPAAPGCAADDETLSPTPTPTTTPATTTASTPPTTTTSSPAPATTEPPAGQVTIVVDPGHNGGNAAHPEIINQPVDAGGFYKPCNTTGASTDDGVTESSINWAVAQQLEDRLVTAGVDVVLTRDGDDGVGPCVDRRGLTAVEAHADVLVSIHADGTASDGNGFHVIHPGLRPGYTDATVGPSAELAVDVRDALVSAGLAPADYVGGDGLDERDDLGTLNRAGVPAVMLEAGNLHNSSDAALLTSPDGQARLADGLAAAVLAFLALA